MASKTSVLRLYRSMLRDASQFKHYNFRSYAMRRVKEEFRVPRSTAADATAAYEKAIQVDSKALHRQSMLSQMYPSPSSIMESVQK